MQRYFDFGLVIDVIIVVILGLVLLIFQLDIQNSFILPSDSNLENFGVSLLTIGATLLGFLLTIITVIVTFKKGFEEEAQKTVNLETETKFSKKITKETKFYNSPIHKKVVKVFVDATYEIGFVIILLLLFQLNIFQIPHYSLLIYNVCLFMLIILSLLRSLFIFKLFLNIHL